jgi:hypothetical protein
MLLCWRTHLVLIFILTAQPLFQEREFSSSFGCVILEKALHPSAIPATMASPGEIPSVGDLVWVRTSTTKEELATVLNVDCEYDEDNSHSVEVATRISRNGVLVEFNATQYQTVQDQNCLRPYTSSPKTRRQRQIITPSPTELLNVKETKNRATRKRNTKEEKQPTKKRKRGSQEANESPHFAKAKKAGPKKPAADREDEKPPKKKVIHVECISVHGSAPDGVFKVENVTAQDSEGDSSDTGYSSGKETDDDRPFQVEYATSGRATCKRCDELVAKGTLRVSHVPLFRGKVRTK